jgi:hypothetical protein
MTCRELYKEHEEGADVAEACMRHDLNDRRRSGER